MDIASLQSSPNADPLVESIFKHGLERHIVELDAYGFTVIPPETLGIGPDFADRLREALLRTHSNRNDEPIGVYRTADVRKVAQNSWWLLEEDDVVVESVLNPVVLTMARWHCGQSAVLGGTSSIIKPGREKGGRPLGLHNDTHGVPPPVSQYAHLVNTSWVLTDYARDEDGPTVLVPGSHRFGRIPLPHESAYWAEGAPFKPVPLRAKAGSLVVWHGCTWHGSMGRSNPGLRVTLVLVWMRVYMKPINLWQDGTSPALVERFPELTRVLGLEHLYPYKEGNPHVERVAPLMDAGLDQFA